MICQPHSVIVPETLCFLSKRMHSQLEEVHSDCIFNKSVLFKRISAQKVVGCSGKGFIADRAGSSKLMFMMATMPHYSPGVEKFFDDPAGIGYRRNTRCIPMSVSECFTGIPDTGSDRPARRLINTEDIDQVKITTVYPPTEQVRSCCGYQFPLRTSLIFCNTSES